jgi:hypothetical protein
VVKKSSCVHDAGTGCWSLKSLWRQPTATTDILFLETALSKIDSLHGTGAQAISHLETALPASGASSNQRSSLSLLNAGRCCLPHRHCRTNPFTSCDHGHLRRPGISQASTRASASHPLHLTMTTSLSASNLLLTQHPLEVPGLMHALLSTAQG